MQLTRSILSKYEISRICGHFELYSTDCPGRNFPLDRIKKEAAIGGDGTSCPGYLVKMNPGLEDDNAKIIQSGLIELGYDVGSCGTDGYFGKGTLDAVKKFQNNEGLTVDGIVGVNTWDKLMS